jgi:hypothetical protein
MGATADSLGLYLRVFRPFLVDRVASIAPEREPSMWPYYWHGVGRGIFFAPEHWLPFTDHHALTTLEREVGADMLGYARSGFAWALTMVNLKQPMVLDRLWIRRHADRFAEHPELVRGIVNAVLMHCIHAEDTAWVKRLTEHARDDPRWQSLVAIPVARALEQAFPVIRDHGTLVESLIYPDLEDYAAYLRVRS